MDESTRLDIELPRDLADSVRARVASGAYASESEMIREGLELLEDRERGVEDWLRTELALGYDAWKSDPSAVHTIDEVRARLREQSQRRG